MPSVKSALKKPKTHFANVPISRIIPDPDQPRKHFDQDAIDELTETMKTHGQLQPIRVQGKKKDFIVIDGERRLRAAKKAGLKEMACMCVHGDVAEDIRLEEQLIANCCRKDLEPMERAKAYERLIKLKEWNQQQLADRLNIDQASVSHSLALLKLTPAVQAQVSTGEIALTVAKDIATIADPKEQEEVAEEIVSGNMNRAAATEAVKKKKSGTKPLQDKCRFNAESASEMQADPVKFGAAMVAHLAGRRQWGGMDVLEVLIVKMGFVSESCADLAAAILELMAAIDKLKKKKAGFPTWTHVWDLTVEMGYRQAAA
jgi:ParB/RepB/Spo0J family partition protein